MGCSLECYRLRIGTFNQKVPKIKRLKMPVARSKGKEKSQHLRFSMVWCLVLILLSMASVSPSLSQKSPIHPAINNKSKPLEQNQVSFQYPYLVAAKVRNKEVHVRNGNQTNRGKPISICYWNKGSSYLINKKKILAK